MVSLESGQMKIKGKTLTKTKPSEIWRPGSVFLLSIFLGACATGDLSLRQNLPDREAEFTFKYFSGFRVESLDAERKSRLSRYQQWLNDPATFEQRSQGAVDSRQTVIASVAANLQRDKSVLEKYQVAQNLDTNRIQREDDFQQALSRFESQRLDQTQRINESTTELIEQRNDLKLVEIKSAFGELNALRSRQGLLEQTLLDLGFEISGLELGDYGLTTDEAALALQAKQAEQVVAEAEFETLSQRRSILLSEIEGLFGNPTSPNGNFVTSLPAPVITEVTLGNRDASRTADTVSLSTNVPQAQSPQIDRQISELATELASINSGLDKLLNGQSNAASGMENIARNDIDSTPLERIRNKEATLEYLLEQMRNNQLTSTATYGGYVQRALPFEIGFQPGAKTPSGVSARVILAAFEDDVKHVSRKVESILTDHIQNRYETNRVYLELISEEGPFDLYSGLMACARQNQEGDCGKYALEFAHKAQSANRVLGVDNDNTDLYRAYEFAIQYLLDINSKGADYCYQSQSRIFVPAHLARQPNYQPDRPAAIRPYRIVVDSDSLNEICRSETVGIVGSTLNGGNPKTDINRGRFSYNTPFANWRNLGVALHRLLDIYGLDFQNPGEIGNVDSVFEFIESLVAAVYTDTRINDSSVLANLGRVNDDERSGEQTDNVTNIVLGTFRLGGRVGFNATVHKPILAEKLTDHIRFLVSPKIVDNSARERVIEIADTEAVSRLLNAAVNANDVSGTTGATVGAEIVNALARSTAFKTRIPYATPFTGIVNGKLPIRSTRERHSSSFERPPYFGWTFYKVPIGIAKNGKLSYEFKTVPAQTTVVINVPQWLRRIKAVYQYRFQGDWIDHGIEAIELSSAGANFDEFRQFVEYEIFDSYPNALNISPAIPLNSGANGNTTSARGCNNGDPFIHVSRHSDTFALCGERLYGVRNLIVGGVMLDEQDLTRVSDKVMLVKTRKLRDKDCAVAMDDQYVNIQHTGIDRQPASCGIELVHEYGIAGTPMHFVWIDDSTDAARGGSANNGSARNNPANRKITMETLTGLSEIYRITIPYVFNKDDPIRSIFVDKRYPVLLAKRSRIISEKRIELDVRKSHLIDFCGQDIQRLECVIVVYITETRDPSDIQVGVIDMADYGWKPYSPPQPESIGTTLTKEGSEGLYILRIKNYRENQFFPLRYVKIGNHRVQNLDASIQVNHALNRDIEFSLTETDLINQCGERLSNCQLDVVLVEKFIDRAIPVGKVTVPFGAGLIFKRPV